MTYYTLTEKNNMGQKQVWTGTRRVLRQQIQKLILTKRREARKGWGLPKLGELPPEAHQSPLVTKHARDVFYTDAALAIELLNAHGSQKYTLLKHA